MESNEESRQFVLKYYNLIPRTGSYKKNWELAVKMACLSIEDQIHYIEEEMIGFDYNLRRVYIEELQELKQQIQEL